MKEYTYSVKGMHCMSCEILVEKKLLELSGVKAVESSVGKGQVTIEYEGEKPSPETLTNLFKKENYIFSSYAHQASNKEPVNKTLVAFNIAMLVVIAFLAADRAGISGFLNVSSNSSLASFFGLGILAGLSSCAALVGGMVLSMSKKWQALYSESHTLRQRFQPHAMFNAGRVLSYAVFGGLLGLAGSRLQLSYSFIALLVIAISLVMAALGLQMLGVRTFQKFQFALPKFITRRIANEHNFQGKHMPFLMGAATFFLPCGFTIIAQGLALLSGSAVKGGLIMGIFALGTAPILLLIGLSSVKFLAKPQMAETFSKAAGFLVLFFALFSISSQMNVLGASVAGILGNGSQTALADQTNLPPIVDGKQVIAMMVYAVKYEPNYFKVRAGVPVRWEITSSGQLGCTSAAILSSLFPDGAAYLGPGKGEKTVVEFTPETPGKHRFTCTMGMFSGTIEVVGDNNGLGGNDNNRQNTVLKVSADDDPVLGNATAPLTLIEFSDFQCPFCRVFWKDTLPLIRKEYIDTGKLKLVYRDYPLSFHPSAEIAAQAGECAQDQGKFWEFHDKLFREQDAKGQGTVKFTAEDVKRWGSQLGLGNRFNQCIESETYKSEVGKDINDGRLVGVSGTPSFFLGLSGSDGMMIEVPIVGALPFSEFKSAIDKLLADTQ